MARHDNRIDKGWLPKVYTPYLVCENCGWHCRSMEAASAHEFRHSELNCKNQWRIITYDNEQVTGLNLWQHEQVLK